VAIIAAVAATLAVTTLVAQGGDVAVPPAAPLGALLPTVLLGCALVFGVGVLDDLVGVSPRAKLLVQGVATVVVMVGGFQPHLVGVSPGGGTLELGRVLGTLLTVLWVVGVTNAFNLIDGIDGLAGSMALVALGTCLLADLIVTPGSTVTLSLALVGAVVAFLQRNWAPARIFLGDSGSMTLGFFLAIRTVVAATDVNGVTYPVVPLAALAYPLVDTFTAMARRWVRGHPFSRADGRHIHHQLRALGFATPRAVQALTLLFATVALLGVAIVFAPARLAAAIALAAGVLLFAVVVYGVRWLGYAEFIEVGASMASVLRNARLVVNEKLRAAEVAALIRQAQSLDEVRTHLAALVADTRVLDMELVALEHGERRHGPPSQQLSHHDALPVRLDYPFVWATEQGERQLLLRVWCTRPHAGAHPVAERVANRVAPALDAWFRERAAPNALEGAAPHPLMGAAGDTARTTV
jgi:UDP-GlcNAc:undecaprenyl-phosphate GlcNAc-1-phosphate transferase